MAEPTRRYFKTISGLVRNALDRVTLSRLDSNPDRSLWEMHGSVGKFDIRVKEIFSQSGRMYSYYVINEGKVEVGFDNYPDVHALRRKYGSDFHKHVSELIPHKHGSCKRTMELTEERSVEDFLEHLQEEILKDLMSG